MSDPAANAEVLQELSDGLRAVQASPASAPEPAAESADAPQVVTDASAPDQDDVTVRPTAPPHRQPAAKSAATAKTGPAAAKG